MIDNLKNIKEKVMKIHSELSHKKTIENILKQKKINLTRKS